MLDLELHSHTRYSPDSLSLPEAVLARCRKLNIARIAITDHDAIAGALAARAIAPDMVIVGEEVMTTQGELLCLFLSELVPTGLRPEDACDAVHAQGGIIGPSHPFDPRRKGLGGDNLRRIAARIDFIEVFNARTRDPVRNALAQELASQLDKPMIVGSDAHTLDEIGTCRVRLPRDYRSPADFLAVLREASRITRSSPASVSIHSRIAAAVHALGLRKPVSPAAGPTDYSSRKT